VSAHLPPFYCPYCGEEDLRPHGEKHGEWVCGSCRRAFALRSVRAEVPAEVKSEEVAR
jgi:ribosomal protein L37AE/L43A